MSGGFLGGVATQARVIHALALRETRTRFGKHRLGYVWALLEPVFWIVTFGGMFMLAGRHMPGGMDLVPFLATGIIPYEMAVKTSDRVGLSIDANRSLLFYPQVQTLDLALARSLLEAVTLTVVLAIITGGYALYTGGIVVGDLLMVVGGLGLASLLGLSFGLLLCGLTVAYPVVERIKGPLMRPLFWISGLFFTANAVPSQFRDILMLNPVLHCVEVVRDGFFPAYHARHIDVGYVLWLTLLFGFAGLTLERVVRRKVQLT